MTNKIKLNHNCPICEKEIILGQDIVTKDNVIYHLECYNELEEELNKEEEEMLNILIEGAVEE